MSPSRSRLRAPAVLPAGLALAFALVLPLAPAPAGAEAWTTFLRAQSYSDVAVRGDTLWWASLEGGLQRYLAAEDRFESFPRRPGGLSSQELTALEFDRSGRLWIGTADAGVSRLSADGTRWDVVSQLDGLPAGTVNVLRAVGDTVLIGTDHGVALWTGTEIAGTVPEGVNPSPFESDVVTGIVLRGDSLWVATDKGLYVSRPSAGLAAWTRIFNFGSFPVLGLAWDGTTLMAVVLGAPYVFRSATGTWEERSGTGTVRGIYDGGGAILASGDGGVYRWVGGAWSLYEGSPRWTGCAVSSPTCDGPAVPALDGAGRVWVANRRGVHELAGGTWSVHVPDAVPGNDIQNLALQGDRVYVATFSDGVGRYDGTRWRSWLAGGCSAGCDTTFLSSSYAFSLLVDRDGRKWVGTWSTAIEEFDDSGAVPDFTHHQPSDSLGTSRHTFGWSSAWDPRGGRWIGMDTPDAETLIPIGIEYYDSAGDYRANYRPENTPTMPNGQIRALHVDQGRGKLWVGYRTNGVNVYDLPAVPGGALVQVSAGLLVPALDVFGIVGNRDSVWVLSSSDLRRFSAGAYSQASGATSVIPITGSPAPRGACHPLDVGPDGTVWVGTDAGVHAYRGTGGGGYTVTGYTTANSPLAGDEVRAIRVDPASGVVWIGTAKGLSRFDPGWVEPPAPPLPSLEVRAFPNPAWQTGVGPGLRLAGNATAFRGSVHDAAGRLLHRFETASGQVFWDGRDGSGQLVRPGIYFVRVEAGAHARTLRVVLLR